MGTWLDRRDTRVRFITVRLHNACMVQAPGGLRRGELKGEDEEPT